MNRFLIGSLAVIALGLGALWWASAPGPAGHSMVPPDTSAIKPGGPIAQVALPAALSEQAQMGKLAFEAYCAQCHGENAAGRNGLAPPLVHKIYEPGHHGDGSFLVAAQQGVRAHHWNFGNMPAVEGITSAEVKTIVAYVRELQRENGI